MFTIENSDADRDRSDFPTGREIVKAGSGLYWNLIGAMYGSEPQHFEPVDPALERMRANVRHYAGQMVAPQPARGFWDRAGGWLTARVARKPDAPVAPAAAPVASYPPGVSAVGAESRVRAQTPRERAAEWLREQLSTGPMQAPEVERRVKESGLAFKTVRRAGKAMGIQPQRRKGAWWWMLPGQDAQGREGT